MIVGDDVRRFWSKTHLIGGCVVWIASRSPDGYGKFMTGRGGAQRTHRAHRWIYERVLGPIGKRYLLHSCDHPTCVSLQHLTPGTQKQNAQDCIAKGRRGKGSAIVDEAKAREIHAMRARGVRVVEIARRYGLSKPGVYAILSGRNFPGARPGAGS